MKSISRLAVSINAKEPSRDDDGHVDGMVFTKMIAKLPDLRELSIGTAHDSLFMNRRFHVESSSLRVLNTSKLIKGVWISCECPKLELFCCRGGGYPLGSFPLFSAEQLNGMVAFQETCVRDDTLRVPFGIVEFAGLSVPATCECVVQEFFSEDYSPRTRAFISAMRFDTA